MLIFGRLMFVGVVDVSMPFNTCGEINKLEMLYYHRFNYTFWVLVARTRSPLVDDRRAARLNERLA